MAESNSHKMGQMIGYAMEKAFYKLLQQVSQDFDLYLDKQGPREARGAKKKVSWYDEDGNRHDLDFVLEREGSVERLGRPVAFIESAWRRYTKHTVAKANEISGALVPLRQTYHEHRPFLGAIIAGEWTSTGITHMTSKGIEVLHLPTQVIVDAFASEGINIVADEGTSEEHMGEQVEKWDSLSDNERQNVVDSILSNTQEKFERFDTRLREHLERTIQDVVVLPLRGAQTVFPTLNEASMFLAKIEQDQIEIEQGDLKFVEIQIRYSNEDIITARFNAVNEAILWLQRQNDLLG